MDFVSGVLFPRAGPLGSSPVLRGGQWAKWSLSTGTSVYVSLLGT